MDNSVLTLIIGGAIGFFSSLITLIISNYLQIRLKKLEWEREDRLKKNEKSEGFKTKLLGNYEDILSKKSNELIFNPNTGELVTQVAADGFACCVGETKIRISKGEYLELASLREGMEIETVNIETNQIEKSKISKIIISKESEVIEINGEIKCSLSHIMLMKNDKTVSASNLKLGDIVFKEEFQKEKIKSLALKQKQKVYNLQFENGNNFYIANGFLSGDLQRKG